MASEPAEEAVDAVAESLRASECTRTGRQGLFVLPRHTEDAKAAVTALVKVTRDKAREWDEIGLGAGSSTLMDYAAWLEGTL